jgi:tetratricopeptide (TPR) repeat protein
MKIVLYWLSLVLLLTSCISRQDVSVWQSSSQDQATKKYTTTITAEKKLELARSRRKEINSIRKWDYYIIKNNPEEALTYYLQVAEKLPDDIVIQKKIAHAYILQRDWKNAYHYYTRVPVSELTQLEQREMLSALFFDDGQLDRLGELDRIGFATGELEYARMIDICYTGIHDCVISLTSYSGSVERVLDLQKVITDAPKISSDKEYRNFALAARLYTDTQYRAVEKITAEILSNRSDYSEVKKLAGFARYQIGYYNQAQSILLEYLEQNPKDLEVIVKLGEIAFAQRDYITSNLYLNNAILEWYTPKVNLERRLAYNYSRLGDTIGMTKVLAHLLQGSTVSEDDYAVAISLALERGENVRAYVWAGQWLRAHPNSAIIAPLLVTALRLIGREDDVRATIESLPVSVRESPIILLEEGILAYEAGDDMTAQRLFDQVVALDETADFALEAKNYLQDITARSTPIPMPEEKEEKKKWWWF